MKSAHAETTTQRLLSRVIRTAAVAEGEARKHRQHLRSKAIPSQPSQTRHKKHDLEGNASRPLPSRSPRNIASVVGCYKPLIRKMGAGADKTRLMDKPFLKTPGQSPFYFGHIGSLLW